VSEVGGGFRVVRHTRQPDKRWVGTRTRPRNSLRPIDLRYVSFPISPYPRDTDETSCHGNPEYNILLVVLYHVFYSPSSFVS
jgi:hypothetical protein